jgi:hypothetical protein
VRIEQATFVFRALAGTTTDCDTTCPDCDPVPEECYNGPIVGGEELEATTTVFLDASYGVYPKDDGGSDREAGAIYPVEIIFTE